METIELIFNTVFFFINCFCLCFVCLMVSKWHRRMEDKLDNIQKNIRHVADRNDAVYINQLEQIKLKLVEEERYEEADKIKKIIEKELKDIEP